VLNGINQVFAFYNWRQGETAGTQVDAVTEGTNP
jgi:hypothetical protein